MMPRHQIVSLEIKRRTASVRRYSLTAGTASQVEVQPGSDRYLLHADVRLKLKKHVGQRSRKILDMDKFRSGDMKEQFEL